MATRSTPLRRPLALALALAALAAGAAACGSDGGSDARGRVLGAQERTVTVKPGERFTIPVRDNASIGDLWRVEEPKPDAAVLTTVADRYTADPGTENMDGAGGTRFFTFEGRAAGTTTVTLFNCFRSMCGKPGISDQDRKLLVRNTYTVTVR